MKTVYLETNGCAVLRHETYKIAKAFVLNGFVEVSSPKQADAIVMTGCAVIDTTESFALESIERIQKERKENSIFVIAGCLPAICGEKVKELVKDAILLKYSEISELDDVFSFDIKIDEVNYNCSPGRHHSFGDPEVVPTAEEANDERFVRYIDELAGSNRAYDQFVYSTRGRHLWREPDLFEIRVSYGCANRCSYCATKLAIGDFVSVPEDRILDQVRLASADGNKRIMLMGDEIGYWSGSGKNIVDLISDIEKIDDTIKIGIRYISPDIIVKHYDDFVPFLKSGKIYYFCAAFQSGSPRILKLMNRNPEIDKFILCMEDIEKHRYPVMRHTQIIVGFPSETAEDVLKTLNCLQRGAFDHVTITKYCPRKGTKSYDYETLPENVVNERVELYQNWLALNRNNRLYLAVKREGIKCCGG